MKKIIYIKREIPCLHGQMGPCLLSDTTLHGFEETKKVAFSRDTKDDEDSCKVEKLS